MDYQSLLAAVSQNTNTGAGNEIFSLGFLLVLVVIIAYRRVYRGMYGAPFSMARLLRIPIVYTIITAISSIFLPLADVFFSLAAGVIGLAAGMMFGNTATFYMQENRIFYKRSPIILVVWLGAFVARIVVEELNPTAFSFTSGATIAGIIVDILLAGSTGLLAGETIRVYKKYVQYKDGQSEPSGMESIQNI